MIILCKEKSGLNSAIYIVDKNPSDDDINFLSLRGRMNASLEYYITNLDEDKNLLNKKFSDEEIVVMLKNNPSKKLFIRL